MPLAIADVRIYLSIEKGCPEGATAVARDVGPGETAVSEKEQSTDIAGALARFEMELRLGLALRDSRPLRAAVLGDAASVFINLPMGGGYMAISIGGVRLFRGHHAERGGGPALSHSDLVGSAPLQSSIAKEATDAAEEGARRLVTDLIFNDRWDYGGLAEWAPLAEVTAYDVAGRIAMGLDRMRRTVHDACALSRADADELVIGYRTFVETLARTTLFATDAGAPWLAEVASVFEWSKWTPSFPLIRERDLRSAAIGARAASRFGPAVIERYLETLRRARHPLFALDAMVGLTAIGIRHPGEREALLRSLEKEVAKIAGVTMPAIEVVVVGHAHARCLLGGERWRDGGSLSRRQDAFNLDVRGRMPIFTCLAGAVENPANSFVRANTKPKSPKLEKELFSRAWSDYPSLESLPESAFGRA